MIQANREATKEVQTSRNNHLIKTSALLYGSILTVNRLTKKNLENLLSLPFARRKLVLSRLERLNAKELYLMNQNMKSSVLYGLNVAGFESKFIAEQTIGKVKWNKPHIFKAIPTNEQFKITNKYLNKSALIKRSSVDAKSITKIINTSAKKGLDFKTTARKIEVALGVRDRTGRILTKKAIESGLANMNGVHYKTVRIARHETRRVQGIQDYNVLQEARSKGVDMRVKLLARLKNTSRQQSIVMNGQLDGEPYGSKGQGNFDRRVAGKFQYPDGTWKIFGQAALKYSMNDGEFPVQMFDEERKAPVYDSLKQYEAEQEKLFDILK
jgi:hypothetical protein